MAGMTEEMKKRLCKVFCIAPLTELDLSCDEIYKMKCKYDNNTRIIMIINMNS